LLALPGVKEIFPDFSNQVFARQRKVANYLIYDDPILNAHVLEDIRRR
jgi:hypothetical protein